MPTPVQVSELGTGVAEVAAGSDHTCARKTDGTLWCWGRNDHGQLGDGTTANNSTPVQVSVLGTAVAEVAAGGSHTCARKVDGMLWCWGWNDSGQLGNGTTADRLTPALVITLGTDVAEVEVGLLHTCARKTNGTLWCWGSNYYGQLGDGTWADTPEPVMVMLGAGVAQVAVGGSHTCARKTDGTLWCWGRNDDGQLGDGTTTDAATPVKVSALGTAVAEVAAGMWHTCARKTDGTLWCWGRNLEGQLGNGTKSDRAKPGMVTLGATADEIAAGGWHTCARKTDGTLWCWGSSYYGQLGDGTVEGHKPSPVKTLFCP